MTVLLKKLNQLTERFRSKFEIDKQICGFSRKKHSFKSYKSSRGDVEGGFEWRVQRNSTRFKKFWLKFMPWWKKSKTAFLNKTFLWTRKCSSVNVRKRKKNYFSHDLSFYLKIFSADLVSSWETLLKSEKKPRELLSKSLSTRWVQFWKELSVSLVSCPKSLNISLKFWNWWLNFFLQYVCLDTQKAVLTFLSKKFCRISKKHSLEVAKKTNNFVVS